MNTNSTKRVYAEYAFRHRSARSDAERADAAEWYRLAGAVAVRDEILATLDPEPGAVVAPVVEPVIAAPVVEPVIDALPEPPAARHEIVDFQAGDGRSRTPARSHATPESCARYMESKKPIESTTELTVAAPPVAVVEKPALTSVRLSEPATDQAYADYDSRVTSAWKTQPPKMKPIDYGEGR